MTFYKKVLAVVLSLVMLISCFAVSASAYKYEPSVTGGELKLSISADKTTVNRGDVVSFEMKIDRGTIADLSAFAHLFLYNGDQLSPVGTTVQTWRKFQNEFAGIASVSAGGNMNFATSNAKLKAELTGEEQAYFTKGILVAGQMASAAYRWNPAQDEVYMTFQMTVSDTVAPGEEIWFGLHDAGYRALLSTFAVDAVVQKDMSVFDLTDSMIKLTVAADEPNILTYRGSQIRFQKDAEDKYAGKFDVRQVAQISKADLITYFGDTEAEQEANIAEAGFVFARTSTVSTLDRATAVSIAKGEKPAGDCSVVPVSYISKNESIFGADNCGFTCIVKNIPTADNGDSLNALAYIKHVDGTYYFYETVQVTSFSTLYNNNFNDACPNG